MSQTRRSLLLFGSATVLLGVLGFGCGSGSDSDNPPAGTRTFTATFPDGWQGDFSDLPVGYDPELYELYAGIASLPIQSEPSNRLGYLLQGHNRSDDLFVFTRRRVTAFTPNTNYRVAFDVEIVSNAPESAFGIGGGPGVAVVVKAGATTARPGVVGTNGYFVTDFDKGSQAESGRDSVVLGNIGIPGDEAIYQTKTLSGTQTQLVRSNALGEIWIYFGIDSGYEGKTMLYLSRLQARFTPE